MLPTLRHKHDEKWLEERFSDLIGITGIKHASAVAAKYSAVYAEVYESTEEGHKKNNRARHEANQRLVNLIKKLQAKAVAPTA